MIMEKTNIRKSNIELLRIIGMLMIVAHHYVVNSGIMNAFETGNTSMNYVFLTLWGMWGKTGINVFILVSGFLCVHPALQFEGIARCYLSIFSIIL